MVEVAMVAVAMVEVAACRGVPGVEGSRVQ